MVSRYKMETQIIGYTGELITIRTLNATTNVLV